jgi:hypothetical protein
MTCLLSLFSFSLSCLQVPEHDPRTPSRVCDACYASINKSQVESFISKRPVESPPETPSGIHRNIGSPLQVLNSNVGMKADAASKDSHGELSMADFEVIKHLGKGAFGQVLEVRREALESKCVTL